MKKIAIILSHPVQYYSPLFKALAKRIKIKVFYCFNPDEKTQGDGFNKQFSWDIPLFDGYDYEFVKNISQKPGFNHFMGLVNPDLIPEVNKFNPDALLVFGWNYQSHFKAMRYFKGKIPVLFRGDSTLWDFKPGINKIFKPLFLRWVYKYVDIALYVGKNNKDYFIAHGLKEKQLVWAPHAVDNDYFRDSTENHKKEALAWKESLGIGMNEIIFLFVGKLNKIKDPLLLLNAFERLNDIKARLIFVGSGPLEDELKGRASKNNMIIFLGFQNQKQMPVCYRLADVLVLPSRGPYETWGLVVNEAMACGLPILSSDKCGCSVDLVHEGVNGYIFKAGDVIGLFEKLNVMMDKDRIRKMGEESLRIISNWSIDVLCEQILKVV